MTDGKKSVSQHRNSSGKVLSQPLGPGDLLVVGGEPLRPNARTQRTQEVHSVLGEAGDAHFPLPNSERRQHAGSHRKPSLFEKTGFHFLMGLQAPECNPCPPSCSLPAKLGLGLAPC